MATNIEIYTERLERQKKEREAFLDSVKISNYKASFVTCPGCGSKIAKQYFETTDCPLCGTSLLSQTNKDRLKSFDDRIAVTESNLNKALENAARRAGTPVEAVSESESGEEGSEA